MAIVGGAKISTKIGVMASLLPRVRRLLVGGAMACTLLKAAGVDVGASKVEEDQLATAAALIAAAGAKLLLPVDAVVAEAFSADADRRVVPVGEIPEGWMMLDVGPETVRAFGDEVSQAGTVVWNGPLGVYELSPFRAGTEQLARRVADSGAVSIVGGGTWLPPRPTSASRETSPTSRRVVARRSSSWRGWALPGLKVLMTEDAS